MRIAADPGRTIIDVQYCTSGPLGGPWSMDVEHILVAVIPDFRVSLRQKHNKHQSNKNDHKYLHKVRSLSHPIRGHPSNDNQ